MTNSLQFKTTVTHDTWVVLWSPHQECFHIETLGEMFRTNMRIYAEGLKGDYIFLGFAESSKQASEFIDQIKERMGNRSRGFEKLAE